MLHAKGREGQAQLHIFLLRISQSEIRILAAAAKARAGRAFIFPTPLFLPAPPERFGARSAPSVPFKIRSSRVV